MSTSNKISLNSIRSTFTLVNFSAGERFRWSPSELQITYPRTATKNAEFWWRLIHECAHAKLEHKTFDSDFQLLQMEVEAWEEAKIIARSFSETIDQEFIEDCLDTYRDWLHVRSTCPRCGVHGIMDTPQHYTCVNCEATWRVPRSQLCAVKRQLVTN